jgi:hypothetical protein
MEKFCIINDNGWEKEKANPFKCKWNGHAKEFKD